MTNDDEHGDEENKKILPAPLKLASRKGWRTDGQTDSWARTEAARGTPPVPTIPPRWRREVTQSEKKHALARPRAAAPAREFSFLV